MHSALYTGRLRHRRYEPVPHAFSYGTTLLWLDLAELDEVFRGRWLWSSRRPALARFRREDYLGDSRQPLDAAVRERVAAETGRRPKGPIRLLTQLRMLGFSFNPVSFYYCYDERDTQVEAIVAEITNTPWNERHAYVLRAKPDEPVRFGLSKVFHVSPFMPMDMAYDWRFSEPADRLAVHMANLKDGRRVFDATLMLKRREISGASLAATLLSQPVAPLAVVARIYWQALRLRAKRVPFYAHPAKDALEKVA